MADSEVKLVHVLNSIHNDLLPLWLAKERLHVAGNSPGNKDNM